MKCLKFKVKKLYDKRKVGHCAEEFPNKLIAYQLTPCGDYSKYPTDSKKGLGRTNGTPHFSADEYGRTVYINVECPFTSILIPAKHYEQFRDAVHSYNLKYADVPDVKVLENFYNWNTKKNLQHDDHNGIDTIKLHNRIEMYKDTLVSPESWFEEI